MTNDSPFIKPQAAELKAVTQYNTNTDEWLVWILCLKGTTVYKCIINRLISPKSVFRWSARRISSMSWLNGPESPRRDLLRWLSYPNLRYLRLKTQYHQYRGLSERQEQWLLTGWNLFRRMGLGLLLCPEHHAFRDPLRGLDPNVLCRWKETDRRNHALLVLDRSSKNTVCTE